MKKIYWLMALLLLNPAVSWAVDKVTAQAADKQPSKPADKAPGKPAVPQDKTTPQQYVHLGNIAGRQEKYRDAIRYYTKAIQAKPDLANAYYNRGWVYVEMGKYKQAIADLKKVIELEPDYAPAYHVRGIAYFERKKYPRAIADYTEAIALDPTNVKFHISRLSAYFKEGDSDNAWKEVIAIQKLGGTLNPMIVNMLKAKNYQE